MLPSFNFGWPIAPDRFYAAAQQACGFSLRACYPVDHVAVNPALGSAAGSFHAMVFPRGTSIEASFLGVTRVIRSDELVVSASSRLCLRDTFSDLMDLRNFLCTMSGLDPRSRYMFSHDGQEIQQIATINFGWVILRSIFLEMPSEQVDSVTPATLPADQTESLEDGSHMEDELSQDSDEDSDDAGLSLLQLHASGPFAELGSSSSLSRRDLGRGQAPCPSDRWCADPHALHLLPFHFRSDWLTSGLHRPFRTSSEAYYWLWMSILTQTPKHRLLFLCVICTCHAHLGWPVLPEEKCDLPANVMAPCESLPGVYLAHDGARYPLCRPSVQPS